jgi:hypothetical protein
MKPSPHVTAGALPAAFGLLMVAATEPQRNTLALVAAALAVTAVVIGTQFRPAATFAVLFSVAAISISEPPSMLAAMSGLCATAYLVLRHANSAAGVVGSAATVIAALGFTFAALLATVIPAHTMWLPLLAPLAMLAVYAMTVQPFVGPLKSSGESSS